MAAETLASKSAPCVEGTALVAGATHQATGRLAFSKTGLSFWGGVDPLTGVVIDERHPLCGRRITDTILAIPSGRGSCTASQIVLELVLNGTAPRAIVLRDRDAVVAVGALVAREFFDETPPLILACADFDALEALDGDLVSVTAEDTPLPLPRLTDADRNALNGLNGPAVQRAMKIVAETARIQGAAQLVDVSAAHIDACTYVGPCVEINQCVGCTRQSSLSHLSAMTRPSWLCRAARNRHHHAIEQASRRWRGGRRDDSARTRRKILISTQVVMIGGMAVQVALADVCGDPGYEDCWEDCPLPDPMEFNHNALFHALYAAGLLALAVGVLCDTADSWTATEKPTDAAKELERV